MRFFVLLVALGACVPIIIPVPVMAPAGEVRVLASEQASDQGFEALLNGHRTALGRTPLTQNAQLTRAAMAHAADMNTRGYFGHRTPEGVDSSARAQAVGLPRCGLGENIAYGQKSSTEVFKGWLASGPHRRNIENKNMASYGLGRAGDKWVLMLYSPC